jgi:hypothetical protein
MGSTLSVLGSPVNVGHPTEPTAVRLTKVRKGAGRAVPNAKLSDREGSTAAVRERPGKRSLLPRQRLDSGRHPSGSHQGWSGHTSAQPVHASSKMSYTQSTFV